ncbi:hypothetical protein Lal_00017729 [Lupinus albus]|nr:hypothetical protein Lal_00017729 [Lupinus albus]
MGQPVDLPTLPNMGRTSILSPFNNKGRKWGQQWWQKQELVCLIVLLFAIVRNSLKGIVMASLADASVA